MLATRSSEVKGQLSEVKSQLSKAQKTELIDRLTKISRTVLCTLQRFFEKDTKDGDFINPQRLTDQLPKILGFDTPQELIDRLEEILDPGTLTKKEGTWVTQIRHQLIDEINANLIRDHEEGLARIIQFYSAFIKLLKSPESITALQACEKDKAKIDAALSNIINRSFASMIAQPLIESLKAFVTNLDKQMERLLDTKTYEAAQADLKAIAGLDMSKVTQLNFANLLLDTITSFRAFRADKTAIHALLYIGKQLVVACGKPSAEGHAHLAVYLRAVKNQNKKGKTFLSGLYHNHSPNCGSLSDTTKEILIRQYGSKETYTKAAPVSKDITQAVKEGIAELRSTFPCAEPGTPKQHAAVSGDTSPRLVSG